MSRYTDILFDLDGTLFDTSEGVIHAIQLTAQRLGLKQLEIDVIKSFIGPPIHWAFEEFYGCSDDEADEAVRVFREIYASGPLYEVEVYDGMVSTLASLRDAGYRIGVATYKLETMAIKVLERYDLTKYFDVIYGADPEGVLTKADIVEKCIVDLGGARDKTVLIGDTNHDALGAKKSGVDFIAVTYGFGFKSEDEAREYNPAAIANYAGDIKDIIIGR